MRKKCTAMRFFELQCEFFVVVGNSIKREENMKY